MCLQGSRESIAVAKSAKKLKVQIKVVQKIKELQEFKDQARDITIAQPDDGRASKTASPR